MKDTAEKALLAIKAAFKMAVHKLPHVEKKNPKHMTLACVISNQYKQKTL